MIKLISWFLIFAPSAFIPGSSTAGAPDKEHAELAKALAGVSVTLEAGLRATAASGKAISAKYEVEDGKLELSVFVDKGGTFTEVIVDHNTGGVAKAEPITEGEDIADAKGQGAAMAKAKQSLEAALARALGDNPGFRAVSVAASLKDGHPTAEVELLKGAEWKRTAVKLD